MYVAELLFQQVPLLRIDGMNLVQSGAIARYLARKAQFYGDTDIEAAKYVLFSASFHAIMTEMGWLKMTDMKMMDQICGA